MVNSLLIDKLHTLWYYGAMHTMPKRKTLTLTDKAADLLPRLSGYRDQGTYVSQLIESAADHTDPIVLAEAQEVEEADLPTLRRLMRRLMRDLNEMEVRLIEVEHEIIGLKAQSTTSGD